MSNFVDEKKSDFEEWPITPQSIVSSIAGILYMLQSAIILIGYTIYYKIMGKRVEGAEDKQAIIIGAGFSGLNAAIQLRELGINIKILEKDERLGGTWWQNQYPGVACDIPSHLYSLSAFQNPSWSKSYSGGAEILSYMEDMATKLDLYKLIQFNEKVERMEWLEDKQKWKVKTTVKEYFTDFIVSATGPLHHANIPKFKGAEDFKGEMFHSRHWKKDIDLTNKRVAVIGTGASAVQIVPSIADTVSQLYVLQRTPCWTLPRYNYTVSAPLKAVLENVPFALQLFRWLRFWMNELMFQLNFFTTRPRLTTFFRGRVTEYFRQTVKDPEVCEKLIPKYPMGCKRITPSDHYLPTFNKPNVKLVTEGIDKFTETGIVTNDGQHLDVDVVVLATGFSILQSLYAYDIIGRDGKKQAEKWGDEPQAYYGVTTQNLPNFFFLLGPNSGLGHNTVLFMMECETTYMVDCIRKLVKSGRSSMELNQQSEGYIQHKEWERETLKKRSFGLGACAAWYVNSRGVNITLWPGDLTHFWRETLHANLGDYFLK